MSWSCNDSSWKLSGVLRGLKSSAVSNSAWSSCALRLNDRIRSNGWS